MALNLSLPGQEELRPRITVFGVGGAGGNAVNNMIEKELEGVDFVVANTDAQALSQSNAPLKIQMGVKVTEGLGAGARPTVGAAAAEESIESIVDHLAGAHMCFITAGMGGGTGTGAAPIIAQAARELGILTVGVVTKPFQFEGSKRMRQAEDGVESLQKVVDTLIIIPNQNLFRLANENTTFTEAFALADDVLYQGVKGVTDLMVRPGLINLDFADVRAVMDEMGKAMMGTGEAEGEDRALHAAEKAIANPLLDEISLNGAKGVLINITGGHDLTLFELDEAANKIREEVDPEANIIVGSTLDPTMEGRMRVSVVATGIDAIARETEIPVPRRQLAQPLTARVSAERADAPVAEPAPAAARAVPAAPAVAEAPPAPGPGLFDDPIFAGSARSTDDGAEDDGFADDGLPPPAYNPQREEPAVQTAHAPAARTENFVAPRPPAGTPTAEALARLQNAMRRSPEQARPQEARPAAPEPRATAPEAERGRFGLNSLINRMTGTAGGAPGAAHHDVPPVTRTEPRQEPVPTSWDDAGEEPDEDRDRIEIPAFLRRQAN